MYVHLRQDTTELSYSPNSTPRLHHHSPSTILYTSTEDREKRFASEEAVFFCYSFAGVYTRVPGGGGVLQPDLLRSSSALSGLGCVHVYT